MDNHTFFITAANTGPTTQNHMWIEMMWLLVRESVYWINMNAYIKLYCQVMHHMLRVPGCAAPGKGTTL